MSFNKRAEKHSAAVDKIEGEYRRSSTWLPFTALELRNVFSQNELGILDRLREEMEAAADDNERAARLTANWTEYGTVMVRLLRMARVLP